MASDIVLTNPATIAAPGGHYTHAVTANGFVFVAGQLPIARDGTKLVEASFEQQAQLTLDNIAATLQAAGSAIDRLVQVRVYLTDVASWTTFNAIYTTWIGLSRPARASCRCRNYITASKLKSRRSRWKARHDANQDHRTRRALYLADIVCGVRREG